MNGKETRISESVVDETSSENSRQESSIYYRPLNFDKFFDVSKTKLQNIFNHKFKRDKIFNDLLLEICKNEIRQNFFNNAMGSGRSKDLKKSLKK